MPLVEEVLESSLVIFLLMVCYHHRIGLNNLTELLSTFIPREGGLGGGGGGLLPNLVQCKFKFAPKSVLR